MDLSPEKFFVNVKNKEQKTIYDLLDQPINPKIYYSPSYSPMLDLNDCQAGSVFQDWYVPTASEVFGLEQSTVLEKTVDLQSYKENLYDRIKQRILDIYARHRSVALAYSGGIDSMVLLSFVQSLGLMDRTEIVCHKNLLQSHQSCLHLDQRKYQAVVNLLDKIKVSGTKIQWLDVKPEVIASLFDTGTYDQMKCYSTVNILNNIQSDCCMFGWHGNQALIHKFIFWDEIQIARNESRAEIKNYLESNSDFYAQSLKNYDLSKSPMGLERRYFLMKPWFSVDGYNQKTVYGPLANDDDLQSLRQLDFSSVSVETVADAHVAREFVTRNVGSLFDPYITTESLSDGDTFCDLSIPLDLINRSLLFVPKNLNHAREPLAWLENEINNALTNGYCPLNTLVSIKHLHWLDSLR